MFPGLEFFFTWLDPQGTSQSFYEFHAMVEEMKSETPHVGLVKRLWRAFSTPSRRWASGLLLAIGGIGGILFWGGYNWAMEISNTEAFCLSCHEMSTTVGEEWKKSPHYQNPRGIRVSCSDCHVPKTWRHKAVKKIKASNELFHKLLGTVDTIEKFEAKRLELARNVWREMKETDSRECRNCHSFIAMDTRKQKKSARRKHERAMEEGGTCIDCHKGIAHELPAGWNAGEEGDEEEKEKRG